MIDLADKLIAYEEGDLEHDEVVAMFQELVDTGLAWSLQGNYGRMALGFAKQGLITLPADAPGQNDREKPEEVEEVDIPVPMRECPGCSYELPLTYFGTGVKPSEFCDTCRDERSEAKDWSEQDIALVLATARPIFDFWTRMLDHWTEEDLVDWRNFLAAVGRDPLPAPTGYGRGKKKAEIVAAHEAARTRIDDNVNRFFAIRERWGKGRTHYSMLPTRQLLGPKEVGRKLGIVPTEKRDDETEHTDKGAA